MYIYQKQTKPHTQTQKPADHRYIQSLNLVPAAGLFSVGCVVFRHAWLLHRSAD